MFWNCIMFIRLMSRRPSTNYPHFMLIWWQLAATVAHSPDKKKPMGKYDFISSETTGLNYSILGRNNVWMVLLESFSFLSDWMKNMTAKANSWFWLADFQKFSPLKLQGQLFWNFLGLMTRKPSTNNPHFMLIWWQTEW